MKRISFWQVLQSNLKCAFCKEEDCCVKYFPQRKKLVHYDGTRFVIRCKKDAETKENNIFKEM